MFYASLGLAWWTQGPSDSNNALFEQLKRFRTPCICRPRQSY